MYTITDNVIQLYGKYVLSAIADCVVFRVRCVLLQCIFVIIIILLRLIICNNVTVVIQHTVSLLYFSVSRVVRCLVMWQQHACHKLVTMMEHFSYKSVHQML